jgi:phosphate-selective porin OprO/OprP
MNRTAPACLLALGLLAAPLVAQEAPGAMDAQDETVEERLQRLEEALKMEQAAKDASAWDFKWSNGFKLASPDGRTSFKFGGRIMNDYAFYSADDELEAAVGPLEEGAEFRRARLFFSGELYDRVEFKAQYDFAGGDPELKDVYLGLVNLPVIGGVRVGHYKEPFSLEEITSSKYITFMERALPVEAFSPSRNTGVMLHRGEERYTWAAGLFRDADDFGDAADRSEVNLTGRVTGLPWYAGDGSRLLHLGLSVSDREPTGDAVRFRSRPESHLSPRLVDTSGFGADGVTLVDLEGALVVGPFSAQGEYIQASVDSLVGPDPDFDSFYVYGSWFLTGEHRPYKNSAGAFDRLKPRRVLGEGPGAWEIAVRYSTLDLTDSGIEGGELDDVTFGLNWYPYANVRWMLNYVMADLDGTGEGDAIQMRFQIDF